jgi:hypothetical protein
LDNTCAQDFADLGFPRGEVQEKYSARPEEARVEFRTPSRVVSARPWVTDM